MYYGNPTLCFIKYLESRDIKVVKYPKEQTRYQNITEAMIKNQVLNICEFHKKTIGYMEIMNKKLDNNIGKTVEQYKVYIKRLSRDLEDLKNKTPNSEFEQIILDKGEEYLTRARKCINTIYINNYLGLIMRSMNRAEICLGDTNFDNLGKVETIEIRDIKDCCYNMVEMDLVYLLGKVKRRGIEVDFNSLIKEFCNLESLEQDSEKFITSMISYPYEFMKCCNRYREKSKSWTEDEYVLKLKKAISAEGSSLI